MHAHKCSRPCCLPRVCTPIMLLGTGVHVANAVAGLAQCCLLLGLPFGCLCTAIKELQIDLLQLKAQCTQFKQHKACSGSRRGSSCGCHCGSSLCIQSSSWCCPCSSCSCRHLGGVQISWQEPGSNGSKACLCSSKTAAAGSGCNNKTSRSAACNSCSGGSNSNYGSSCCSQVNIQGSSEAETGNAAAAWPNADCQCGQCTRQRADEKVRNNVATGCDCKVPAINNLLTQCVQSHFCATEEAPSFCRQMSSWQYMVH